MAETIVAAWPKNSREEIRVRLDTYQGQPIICIRAWYPGKDGAMLPGKGGFTVATRHLPNLALAIAKALDTARGSGLIHTPEGGAT